MFLMFLQNLWTTETVGIPASSDQRPIFTMGFELETNVFKLRSQNGPVLQSKDQLWELIADTADSLVRSAEEQNLLNTEARTINGHDQRNANEIAIKIKEMWNIFGEKCPNPEQFYDIPELDFMNRTTVDVKIRIPKQENRSVLPQITYCLPLNKIGDLIEHLKTIINKTKTTSSYFLFGCDHTQPELDPEDQERLNASVQRILDGRQKPGVQNFLKNRDLARRKARENISQDVRPQFLEFTLAHLETLFPNNNSAKGLAWLFTLYAFSFFMDNADIVNDEGGPKPELGIMSRIPFSDMYKRLPHDEQELFKRFVESLDEVYLNRQVRKYKTESSMMLRDEQRFTLREWYHSIINPHEGAKDLLSPPRGFISYAMGKYNPDDHRNKIPAAHALVEVRSYTNALLNRNSITIDNFKDLIENEAAWFFGELAKSGGVK